MPVIIRNKSYDIAFGHLPIEKMGGDKIVTYSMYGDEIPLVLEDGEVIVKVRYDSNIVYLTNKGNLYGCGANYDGQLGLGHTENVTQFIKIAENVKDFSATTANTTWYLTNNGDLYGCGNNSDGQQGSGSTSVIKTFTKRASNVKKMYCLSYTSWYIDNNDDLYGCGINEYGEQGSGSTINVTTFTKRASNVKDLFTTDNGRFGTWYITNDGDLYGCGSGKSGQQGNGSTLVNVTKFTKRASNVKYVHVRQVRTLYIDNNNDLYSCGSNIYGQQGNGNTTDVKTFTKIASNIKDFDCSHYTTFYIDQNNNLYGCGCGDEGQQGNDSTTAVNKFTKRASNVKKVICGDQYSTWYIDNDDNLYGCGMGNYGMQGSGDTNDIRIFTKRAENVKYVHSYLYQTFYITNDNELYSCGCNYNNSTHSGGGQGTGDTTDVLTFTKRASNVKEASVNYDHSWYLTNDNKLFATGVDANNCGQLGLGYTSTDNYVFTEAKLLKE